MKTTQSEIKQNIQGTNSDRKETRTQINNLEQKEEINIQPEQNEETRELTENRTVWKSDNQGVKEETFIQTRRMWGDGQLGTKELWQGGGWQTGQPHIHVRINKEDKLGRDGVPSRETKPQSLKASDWKNL